jgi:ribokinase
MANGQDKPRIVVVGSSNMDLVVKSPRIPALGETVLGGDFIMTPGGKGANQAVAAAKLGAEVYLVAKLGEDMFGDKSLDNFKATGVSTQYVTRSERSPSGVALITVDQAGNNVIVVASGANKELSAGDVRNARPAITSAGALVAQLEVPLETVEFAAQMATNACVPFILNPAPAQKLGPELLSVVDVLTPNETEAQILTGIEVTDEDSARKAAASLLDSGAGAVALTMGSKGYLLATEDETAFVPAIEVEAIDATAAGDAFTGSLAVGLARGEKIISAAYFANHVAALSVTKMGAQSSMPSSKQVENFMKNISAQGVKDEKK